MVSTQVRIGNRWIGEGRPCFIIAEAGSNHNVDLNQAKRLIDVACQARADAVKFQLFRASKVYPRNAGQCDYLKLPKSIYEMVSEMEMPYEWLPVLSDYCRGKKILFLASVFDEESADRIEPYVEAFKISSYEMTHIPLIRHVALKGKPIILSTGAASLEEVQEVVSQIREVGNPDLILLQCTAAYPVPFDSLNLRAILTLKSTFQVPVGLSDHSRDPLVAPIAAVALGSAVIEKHFTLDNDLPGPDHRFAVEPEELKWMVEKIRAAETALGSGKKLRQPVEEELYSFARRSILAVRSIKKGEKLTPSNAAVLRHGKHAPGLHPRFWESVIGKAATRDIAAEEPIGEDDLE